MADDSDLCETPHMPVVAADVSALEAVRGRIVANKVWPRCRRRMVVDCARFPRRECAGIGPVGAEVGARVLPIAAANANTRVAVGEYAEYGEPLGRTHIGAEGPLA